MVNFKVPKKQNMGIQLDKEDPLLNASIDKGLTQSAKREVKPHEKVMKGLRKKYEI